MTRATRPFRPGVEALAARVLPASVSQTGSVLQITGGQRNDTIQIGELGGNRIELIDGRKATQIFDNVTEIVVKTLGGKDRVLYAIQTLAINNRTVSVDLGAGNDVFQGDWTGTALGSNTSIWVNGGTNSDRLSFSANGVIPTGEIVGVALLGGAGTDVIQSTMSVSLLGHLNVIGDGARDNDAVAIQVAAQTNDTGTFLGRVNGGAGNDNLVLTITQPNDPNRPWWETAKQVVLDGIINGGAGKDATSATEGVQLFNIP